MHDQTISEDTEAALALIRKIVESYIDHPQSLSLGVRDFRDEVSFEMQVHTDDMKRCVGSSKGAHIAALEHLVRAMGRARQVVHKLRLIEPEPGIRREDYPAPVAESFDPDPIAELISDVVLACGIDEVKVETEKPRSVTDPRLTFAFIIHTRTVDDWEALRFSPPKARMNLSVESALSILMDASAKRSGVLFRLSFPKPETP